jgi:tRNA pseudouridine38-40 synthase
MIRLLLIIIVVAPFECWIQQPCTTQRRRRSFSKLTATKESEHAGVSATSILLLLSYDGGRFTGWSDSNKGETGFVRSVEGVLKQNFAKLFGDIEPSRIIVEGTSRTDKGVHAKRMIAQVYCLSPDWEATNHSRSTIPGKRLPHPRSSTDETCFVPFPMDLTKLVFVLNRILPHDISVRDAQPSPFQHGRPFHPTLDAATKTYRYSFSAGPMPDPTQWRRTWHVGKAFEENEHGSNLEAACLILQGTNDFRAFRGAPRGKNDRQRQLDESTICTLSNVSIELDTSPCPIPELQTYHLSITGDRFVYKMVRFIAGSLVAIGQGTLSTKDLSRALDEGSFAPVQKPQCAPGCGLALVNVTHDTELTWLK